METINGENKKNVYYYTQKLFKRNFFSEKNNGHMVLLCKGSN